MNFVGKNLQKPVIFRRKKIIVKGTIKKYVWRVSSQLLIFVHVASERTVEI